MCSLFVPSFLLSLNCETIFVGDSKDHKRWCLSSNGCFTVKSFYVFLNNGGMNCQTTNLIWKSFCPRKISLFNWLAWENSIFTFKNLAKRKCNRLLTTMRLLSLFIICSFIVPLQLESGTSSHKDSTCPTPQTQFLICGVFGDQVYPVLLKRSGISLLELLLGISSLKEIPPFSMIIFLCVLR